MTFRIRQLSTADYSYVISVIDQWWGGRQMADMLPRLFFEHFTDDKHKEAQMLYDVDPPGPLGAIEDDRLRLIFICCHPALAIQTRVALTLRMVAALTVPEIASQARISSLGRKPGDRAGMVCDSPVRG